MEKPPLGIMPRKIWNEIRICEILEAMIRYSEANKPIPKEWIVELKELSTLEYKDCDTRGIYD